MRARSAGLALILVAGAAWLAFVPPRRQAARSMAEERAVLEQRRLALAADVAELERRVGAAAPTGAKVALGPVALRAEVVDALGSLASAEAVRLDVTPDGREVSLSLFGELGEVLDLLDRLTHPRGPATLSRVSLRPRGDGRVQLQLDALQPGAGP